MNFRLIIGIFAALLLISTSKVSAIEHYKDAIYFGNYLTDLEATFEKSVKRNGWSLSKNASGEFFASIAYKSYDIKAQLVLQNNTVKVVLLSATRPECKRRCDVDTDKIEGWLVRLRKSLAYDITYAVRDDALKKSASSK